MKAIEKKWKTLSLIGAFGVVASSLQCAPVHAADYPTRPITIVVPYSAGGGTDLIARLLAEGLSKKLKESVVVTNRPGGGGVIGSNQVANSSADGYTLMLTSSAHAINPGLRDDLPYTVKSFTDIALIADEPGILITPLDRPYRDLGDVLRAAKENPGKLTYGSTGIGATTHMSGELFKNMANVDLLHVPYKGGADQMADLVGGRLDLAFATTGTAGAILKAGRARALAITTPQRSGLFPDLPTFDESGVPGYAAALWYGVFGPAKLPQTVVEKLSAAIVDVMHSDEVRNKLEKDHGYMVRTMQSDEFSRYVAAEVTRWGAIIKSSQISK